MEALTLTWLYIIVGWVLIIWAEKAELHSPFVNITKVVIAFGFFVTAAMNVYDYYKGIV